MANTEILAALAKVRLAKNAVTSARSLPGLSPAEQTSLDGLVFDLNDLEDSLILTDITQKLESIRADSADLSKTAAAMTTASAKLASTIQVVDDAAKAVGGLTQVVSLAVTHGLLS